jgi:DNA-binding transcriptional regulator YdaS (Cro superfamily)
VPPFGVDSTKYESQYAFAKRVGITRRVISDLIKSGLPKAKNRWVHIEDGLQWLRREGLLTAGGEYIRKYPRSMPGFDTLTSFAGRICADPATVSKWIEKGLPVNELRLIPVEDGVEWLRRKGLLTEEGKYITTKPRSMPGCDSRSSFAKRVGVHPTTVSRWIEKGMPTTGETKLIPVDAALRWVKENCPQHQPNQGTAGENRAVREAAE